VAKYSRHDPRNKKKNKHKNYAKEGRQLRMHGLDREERFDAREVKLTHA